MARTDVGSGASTETPEIGTIDMKIAFGKGLTMPRSAIRMATGGCFRRSRRAFRAGSGED
jgi:hypothetical protein